MREQCRCEAAERRGVHAGPCRQMRDPVALGIFSRDQPFAQHTPQERRAPLEVPRPERSKILQHPPPRFERGRQGLDEFARIGRWRHLLRQIGGPI